MFNSEILWNRTHLQEVKIESLENLNDENEKIDANVVKVIKTMKLTEISLCHVKYLAFEAISNNSLVLELIKSKISQVNAPKENLFVDIEVAPFFIHFNFKEENDFRLK